MGQCDLAAHRLCHYEVRMKPRLEWVSLILQAIAARKPHLGWVSSILQPIAATNNSPSPLQSTDENEDEWHQNRMLQ
eukprot:4829060-Karenia_brevis.AAC.1